MVAEKIRETLSAPNSIHDFVTPLASDETPEDDTVELTAEDVVEPEAEPEVAAETTTTPELPWMQDEEADVSDRLSKLKGVGDAMERRLKAAGIKTFADLAGAELAMVQRLIGNKAEAIIEAAREQVAG